MLNKDIPVCFHYVVKISLDLDPEPEPDRESINKSGSGSPKLVYYSKHAG
jgi:hypothetical protein